ncbi:MAG: GntR family transcriptional regulator [Actinoplanes sp.]
MPIPASGYREVAEDLAARIRSGEYAPGERLPTYNELSDLLQTRGLVVGPQGRGLWVAEKPTS